MRWFVAALVLALALPAHASTIVLDFEEEAVGTLEDDHVSVECACVVYGDAVLEIFDTAFGNVLANTDDTTGGIWLRFFAPIEGLSLDFLDSVFADPGSAGALRVFLGSTLVAETHVMMDTNGLLDQSIAISGAGPFDQAVFRVEGPNAPLRLGEAIDNVVIDTLPEPRVVVLLLALAMLLGVRHVDRVRG